jgi:hypothetical protein
LLRFAGPRWHVGGRDVCRKFWHTAVGVSCNKAKAIRQQCDKGPVARATSKRVGPRPTPKSDVAFSFWKHFFSTCQRPNNDVRLFPTNKTMDQIWTDIFLPWWEKAGYPAKSMPGKQLWEKTRWDEDFKDVKKRPKHHHLRCATCDSLRQRSLALFASGESRTQYAKDERMHRLENEGWRRLETTLSDQSKQSPQTIHVFASDDTNALALPRMTNRDVKNFTKTRFKTVPWMLLDHSGRRSDYVYMSKKRYPKGANRLITLMHLAVRRAKSDHVNGRHRARHAVFIADNCSENKNNTIYAYVCHLVAMGWYDTVDLLFGPVGHTHNGVDANHHIHNDKLGDMESACLGHYIQNYAAVWHSAATRPDASILDHMLDWNKYYAEYKRTLSGFTKTDADELTVRGFRAQKDANGVVELRWKQDPANDQEWRGADGTAASPGFRILKGIPAGSPEVIDPNTKSLCKPEYLKSLTNKNTSKVMTTHGFADAVQYTYDCAKSGVVPVEKRLEDCVPCGEWGYRCTIGSSVARRGHIRMIDKETMAGGVWDLPESMPAAEKKAATSNLFHPSADAAAHANAPLPILRFANQLPQNAPVWQHPNNVAAREEAQVVSALASVPATGVLPVQGRSRAVIPQKQTGVWVEDPGADAYFLVDFTLAKVGHFAVCKAQFNDVSGISVIEIESIDQDDKSITGKSWVPSRVKQTDRNCVAGKWSKPRKVNRQDVHDTSPDWSVIAYFKRFTKKGLAFEAPVRAAIEAIDPWDPLVDRGDSYSDTSEDDEGSVGL